MRRLVIILSILVIWALYASTSDAKDPSSYAAAPPDDRLTLTKLEAMKALLNGNRVYKCVEQELSDKATIRNKKVNKK